MQTLKASQVDEAIARLIYAENLSFTLPRSPHFRKLVDVLHNAPPVYKPPYRGRLSGDLLDATVRHLRACELLIREAVLSSLVCSLICDGWDDVQHYHLINLLYGTAAASFFEGTTLLDSSTHEDAASMANFMLQGIDKLTPVATVVNIVTDTCNTMKAAWNIVQQNRCWVSATCCAPHVLNLLLKDIATIPDVSAVMEKMERILRVFWGRSRWPRNTLREVARRNHGKQLGLYKAKVTCFAGKV
jgi:hypothetical protein